MHNRLQKILSKLFFKVSIRTAALIAMLLMTLSYFFPVWGFSIFAPQYPEGLHMAVWLNNITGDIQSINTLNHYVGMHPIEVAKIPEFRIVPWVMAALIAGIGLVALVPRRSLLVAWIGICVLGALIGMVDMYRWGYEFGHNLDPDAPIKAEGMTYQPPLIGKKVMLNILSYSYPQYGGVVLVLALFIAFLPLLKERFLKKSNALAMTALLSLLMSGCFNRNQPEPIQFGKDTCATCKMTISDYRFGGEVLTKTGKVFKFDAIDCMKDHIQASSDQVAKIFVVDFHASGTLISGDEAKLVSIPTIRGPMGQTYLASANLLRLKEQKKEGPFLDWKEWFELPETIKADTKGSDESNSSKTHQHKHK